MRFYKMYRMITEGIGINYKAPTDPRQYMADFYILSYLSTINTSDKVSTAQNIRIRDYEAQVSYMQGVLLDFLKPRLLDDIFYSIVAEMGNFPEKTIDENAYVKESDFENVDKIKSKLTLGLSDKEITFLADFIYHNKLIELDEDGDYTHEEFDVHKDNNGYPINRAIFKENGKAYESMKYAMKKNNIKPPQAVSVFKKIFYDVEWLGAYGGRAWGNIADAWFRLYFAKTPNNISVAIDHIFDLQHNTGTVLNKIGRYKREDFENGFYAWIGEFLDMKRNAESIAKLLPYASHPVVKTAIPILRHEGFHGEYIDNAIKQRREYEVPEYDKINIGLMDEVKEDDDYGMADFQKLMDEIMNG